MVRQELVARQLAAHLPAARPARILDVGCGQGTQLLRLAWQGHQVTGLDYPAYHAGTVRGRRRDRNRGVGAGRGVNRE